MKKITVIIPFLNEGEEVHDTVQSLRETAGETIDILLINDASTDGFNYSAVAEKYDTDYIQHVNRKGVAFSRDEGIEHIRTDYFLLLDAHMRIWQSDWTQILMKYLEEYPRTIFCCQTEPLINGKRKENHIIKNNGAYIVWEDLSVQWNYSGAVTSADVEDIPCLLGASYATNVSYWKYLQGLMGLRSFGYDEQLISMKCWLEGGSCKLIKSIIFGHKFRQKEEIPYQPINKDYVFNQLYLAELFLARRDKVRLFKKVRFLVSGEFFNEIVEEMKKEEQNIFFQKDYYQKIFQRKIDFVHSMNEIMKKRHENN